MKTGRIAATLFFISMIGGVRPARADAPAWMHNLVNASLPAHDEKTDAVVLYSEDIVTVLSADKIRETVRVAYKILRPNGRERGTVFVEYNPHRKITSVHGWCIPGQGKDYEVKDKDSIEISLPKISGSDLISDVKDKMLLIPASEPGSIVGYEYEVEESPLILQTVWGFQENDPVKDAKFTIQLPPGWEYKAVWRNYTEIKPTAVGNNSWQWSVSDVKGLRAEEKMPPWPGIAGYMVVNYFPGSVANNDRSSFQDWQQMGSWYLGLTRGRRDASPEIKQKVQSLTSSLHTSLEKMQAIAQFVQRDVRYVAISLGIGGIQPHSASDVFQHRYGDCKDKVTLMSSMLAEIGVESYYVIINSERGSVSIDSPASIGAFDHVIIAIKLPENTDATSLLVTRQDAKLGKLLFFDPTVSFVPFGQIGGYLQESYALLVRPDGGELVTVPRLPAAAAGTSRRGVLRLDSAGNVTGDFTEIHRGDAAWEQREYLKSVPKESDRVKTIEAALSNSLPNYVLTKASLQNLELTDQPFGFLYSVVAQRYAKTAGDLLLVRPRVIGVEARGLLETKGPRQFPVIFDGPVRDTDAFEITMPVGYEVDDLPPPVDMEYSFASYHSKTEASGNVLKYSRTFEIKELSVPLNKIDDLKKFYRVIAGDERNTAVLKPVAH